MQLSKKGPVYCLGHKSMMCLIAVMNEFVLGPMGRIGAKAPYKMCNIEAILRVLQHY